MSHSTFEPHEVSSQYLDSTNDHLLSQQRNSSVLFLVTDDWEFYRELSRQPLFMEELIWVSTNTFLKKSSLEISDLLAPAQAVLIDWSKRSATLLSTIRRHRIDNSTPVLALCNDQEAEHVAALILGADETMSRHFNPIMLNAKLVAYQRSLEEKKQVEQRSLLQLKQSFSSEESSTKTENDLTSTLSIGVLSIDKAARVFYADNKPLSLTPMEFDLMAMLMSHEGICLKRDQIINTVWGIEYETGTNFLDVHIHAIRRKLRRADILSCIFTVRGIGYRFDRPLKLGTAA